MSNSIYQLCQSVLLHDGTGLTDAQLLGTFVEHHDEAAIAALVRRHGPMVWGVCRRILTCPHDAEDAFQATFLVLVRRASSIAPREMVANWLYGVARRTALKARAALGRRQQRERQITPMPEPAIMFDNGSSDLRRILDQELASLPQKYRVAIVLGDLEGMSRREAARQLGIPEGTFAARLARGRHMLARRLAWRGVSVSSGVLVSALAREAAACVPPSVLSSTIRAATVCAAGSAAANIASGQAAALAEGVLQTMLTKNLKTAIAVVLTVVIASAGAGGLAYKIHSAEPPGVDNVKSINLSQASGGEPVVTSPTPPQIGNAPAAPDPLGGTNALSIPPRNDEYRPPTPEEMRAKYVKLHQDLSKYMSAVEVKQRIDVLEREVAIAREKDERRRREQKAADELERIRTMLGTLASAYPETEAGRKALAAAEIARVGMPTPAAAPVPATMPPPAFEDRAPNATAPAPPGASIPPAPTPSPAGSGIPTPVAPSSPGSAPKP